MRLSTLLRFCFVFGWKRLKKNIQFKVSDDWSDKDLDHVLTTWNLLG